MIIITLSIMFWLGVSFLIFIGDYEELKRYGLSTRKNNIRIGLDSLIWPIRLAVGTVLALGVLIIFTTVLIIETIKIINSYIGLEK